MSRTLIYLIGIFALWFYLSMAKKNKDEPPTIEDWDNAGSGHGGTPTNWSAGQKGGYTVNSRYGEVKI